MRYIICVYLFTMFLYGADFERGNQSVLNKSNNMMWQDNIDVEYYTGNWNLAKEYCKSLTLNGYTNWKLPTIKELQTIVDISAKELVINNKFQYVVPSSYWSSSPDMKNKYNAWYVGFKSGATFTDSKDYDCYVRCIRKVTIND